MRGQMKLGEILVQSGVIDEFQLRAALDEHERRGHRLGITLVRLGFLQESELVRALAAQLQLPIVHLDGKRVDPEILDLVPQDICEKHNVLPLFLKDRGVGRELFVGMEDPCDQLAREDIARYADMAVTPVIVAASELAVAIDRLYRDRTDDPDALPDAELEDITETLDPPPPEPVRAVANPGDADTRVILQALSQLLVEAGVVKRDELMARIAALERRKH